jgi:hypothetical protein
MIANRSWVEGIIASAQAERFFGKVIVIFERGKIEAVKVERTMKPPPV